MDSRLTIDYMMIVGKYFRTCADYVNLMRVSKRYSKITKMYKFNPISDCTLFPNIQTQHFYMYRDIFYRSRGMYQYVYWVNRLIIRDYLAMIDTSRCVFKSTKVNHMIKHATEAGHIAHIADVKYNINIFDAISRLEKGCLVFEYNDIYIGFTFNHAINDTVRLFDSTFFVDDFASEGMLVTVSERKMPLKKLYVRDIRLNEILCIYMNDGAVMIQMESRLSINLPIFMGIVEWCVIECDFGTAGECDK